MSRAYGWTTVGLVAVLAAAAGPAHAHVANISSTRIFLARDAVEARVNVNARDLEAALGVTLLGDGTGVVDLDMLDRSANAVSDYVTVRAVVVMLDGVPCGGSSSAPVADAGHVLLDLVWHCGADAGGLRYRVTLFQEIDPLARHIVLITGPGDEQQALLTTASPEVALTRVSPDRLRVAGRFTLLGIEHIFTGYDHIAFLLAVIAWANRVWTVIKVVTAFTVAHSITLSAAVLGLVSIPVPVVEALIAATVVYVAAENFYVHVIDGRWRLTFFLGLIHGLGFASVLRELGLPRDSLITALASFNAGVEVGQAAIVCLAVPVLVAADRWLRVGTSTNSSRTGLVYVLSGVILLLGLYWLGERVASV